ncbi:MAG: response regulator transcription factor [Clostridiales bacterium]|nr:response regulator transcription factor [Candidatus Cacconaster stercorequi]
MIFCIEDDKEILGLELYTLETAGFEARGFSDSAAFWEALRGELPQLILLDIMLPMEDGVSILKKLRGNSATADIPIIMATAKGSEYDKVIALDSGADDYLVKPFGMMEMVSRIKAVLRRSTPKRAASVLRRGNIAMDKARHFVSVGGEEIRLTLKEYELLQIFMENPNQVFSRDRLLSAVWGVDFLGGTRTVDVHLGTLRTKLGDAGSVIETVRGVGYRMAVRDE